jgi:hypothetical protein
VQIKAKNLRELEIGSSSRAREGLVGDLMRKGTAYDVWSLDPASPSSRPAGGDQEGMISSGDVGVGAEELNGLSVLLPRKRKKGKLYLGTSRVARRSRICSVRCELNQFSFFLSFFQLKSPSRGILSSLRAPRGPQDRQIWLHMRRPSGRRILMRC